VAVVTPERSSSTPPEAVLIQAAVGRQQLLHQKTAGFTPAEHQMIRRGEHALRQLLELHRGLLLRLVATYQSRGYNAHNGDLEQEATLAFFDAVASFDSTKGAKLSTWAYYQVRARLQVITGHGIQQALATAKLTHTEATTTNPESVHDQGLWERLRFLLHRLTPKQQQVVSLHLEGWGWREIAERVQSTADAVRMLWSRALRRLRLLLGDKLARPQPRVPEPQPVQPAPNYGAPLLRRLFHNLSQKVENIRSLFWGLPKTEMSTHWACLKSHCSPPPPQQSGRSGYSSSQRLFLHRLSSLPWRLESKFSHCRGVRGSPLASSSLPHLVRVGYP
jgi:RNA polymerase sigma factor (sigma-70 family)